MMQFFQTGAEIYVQDGVPVDEALARTTDLVIAAHPDDVEIMAFRPILACFQNNERWLSAVIVTDGASSARSGVYDNFSDDDMKLVRRKEQKKAAAIGEYGALMLLDWPSSAAKDSAETGVVADLIHLLEATRPARVYTHNLADKHDAHVAVALRAIAALRAMPQDARPEQVLGCEVWRDLDWLPDDDKVALDCSAHEGLQAALLGVFDSQIAGGKRYDLATLGRRKAHATFFESHATDAATGLAFAMDLTPLLNENSSPESYLADAIARFQDDVITRIRRFSQT